MKNVYKLTPVNGLDLIGIENWLEEMALRGLYLESFLPHYCRFRRGEPKQVRVRLEPNPRRTLEDKLPRDKEAFYREAGWTFACEVGHSALVFYSEDLNAPELHTDPTLLADRVHIMIRRSKLDIWFACGFLLLFAVYLYRHPFRLLQFCALYASALLLIAMEYKGLRRLREIERDMEAGIMPERLSPSPKWQWLQLAANTLWVLYILIFMIFPVFPALFGIYL